MIAGDNPFHITGSGGMGAVWIRTNPRSAGRIRVTATHFTLGNDASTSEFAHRADVRRSRNSRKRRIAFIAFSALFNT
jgi:hypothetical protein